MSWRRSNVSDQRLEFAVKASMPGACMASLCREYGVSRQTGYTWLQRFRLGGATAVVKELSRRPGKSPGATSGTVVEAIRALREEKPDWGARKLLPVLRAARPELAEAAISTTTVHRILERENLIAPQDRRKVAIKRFERQAPNELWQMDFKGPQGFNKGTGPLSIQDDHSRYLLTLKPLGCQRLQPVQAAMQKTFEESGLPEFLLIDHGTPWYNATSPWGWTELTVWILRQGVRVILSGVRHPQTQGKVERMHGALQAALSKRKADAQSEQWLESFRHEYNHVRPHEGIGMLTPATRWQPSPRCFQPHPREWEYPVGWEVFRLTEEGRIRWQNRTWEISLALRDQNVGVQRVGDRGLVYFCNIALRELDLRSGKSAVLPANPFRQLQC
jgi:transposase InsO family protein